MTLLTALRTGATSTMAAKYPAKSNARTMALTGTGAQSEFQTLAIRTVRELKTIRYFDIDPAAMEKYAHNMADSGLELVPCLQAGTQAFEKLWENLTLTPASIGHSCF